MTGKIRKVRRNKAVVDNGVQKYAEGKTTLRQAAEEYERDLQSFMEILSQRGLALPEEKTEDLQGFERRQYDYVIGKIAGAIKERAGKDQVDVVKKGVSAGSITVKDGAKKLGLKLGDFAIVLEAEGLLNKKEIKEQLE